MATCDVVVSQGVGLGVGADVGVGSCVGAFLDDVV